LCPEYLDILYQNDSKLNNTERDLTGEKVFAFPKKKGRKFKSRVVCRSGGLFVVSPNIQTPFVTLKVYFDIP
jgi:hypothetical protein